MPRWTFSRFGSKGQKQIFYKCYNHSGPNGTRSRPLIRLNSDFADIGRFLNDLCRVGNLRVKSHLQTMSDTWIMVPWSPRFAGGREIIFSHYSGAFQYQMSNLSMLGAKNGMKLLQKPQILPNGYLSRVRYEL